MEKITIYINREKHELGSEEIRVEDLIVLGGGNSKDYELQKRKSAGGPVEETFADPEEVIKIRNDDHFTTRYKGPINPA